MTDICCRRIVILTVSFWLFCVAFIREMADASWSSAALPLSSDSDCEQCSVPQVEVKVGLRKAVDTDPDQNCWEEFIVESFRDVVGALGEQIALPTLLSGATGLNAEKWALKVPQM